MRYLTTLLLVLIAAACTPEATTIEPPAPTSDQTQQKPEPAKEPDVSNTVASYELKITGMHCPKCQKSVTTMLEGMDGVAAAEVDWQNNHAKVTMKPGAAFNEDRARELIGKDFVVESISPVTN